MGKKYLETKTGSLEQSILGLWEKAAEDKMDEKYTEAQRRAKEKARKGGRTHGGDSQYAPGKSGKPTEDGGDDKGGVSGTAAQHQVHKDKRGRSHKRVGALTPATGFAGDQGQTHTSKYKTDFRKNREGPSSTKQAALKDKIKKRKDALKKQHSKKLAAVESWFDAEILELDNLLEATGDKEKYQAARDKVLKGFGVKSCAALPTEEEKKACFKALDDAHVADHEESVDYAELHNKINTSKTKNTREMWEDAVKQVHENAKVKKEQDDEEEPKKKGKTATGKQPDVIDINPDVDEIKPK